MPSVDCEDPVGSWETVVVATKLTTGASTDDANSKPFNEGTMQTTVVIDSNKCKELLVRGKT